MENEKNAAGSTDSKIASIQHQQHATENESLSHVDLSNQKMDNSELDIGEPSDQHQFSKTATNEFLAVSNQKSAGNAAGPYVNANGMHYNGSSGISNILDSQTSSPAVKSDMALRTTAQFTHMQMPSNVNVRDQGVPMVAQNGKQNRAPAHQQVLAASSAMPGHHQTSHLKSASGSTTSHTGYLSTGGYNSASAKPTKQMQNLHQNNSVQGRPTETVSRRTTGKLNQNGVIGTGSGEPLNALGQGTTAARSAVLQTASQSKSNASVNGREIKKISSKTKGVSEKARKRQNGHFVNQQAQDSALNMPNEVFGYHHQPSKSHARRMDRNSNLQGPGMVQNLDLHQSTHNSDVQNTPQQTTNAMFQGGPPMPTGDQYQGFSFMTPLGQQNPFQFMQSASNGFTAQQQLAFPMQQQPQVHFIAKQQKFYGISPDRAPLIFKQSSNEKRPYTSSGQVIAKRTSKNSAQSSAIAALYMGSKTHQNGFGVNGSSQKQRNQSHPIPDDQQAAYAMQNFPGSKSSASRQGQLYQGGAQTYNRKQQQAENLNKMTPQTSGFNQKLPEQLQEEVLKFKQNANSFKEENMKLKTKVKILENELGRKERTLEEFLQQNQYIQNAQRSQGVTGNTLAPIVQTAQRYQAETYLIMSLKKQVKEQKADKIKLEEELAVSKRTVKNTKFYEMDQEIKLYKDELIRLRYLLEQSYSPGLISSGAAMSEGAPSARPSTHALPFGNLPFMMGQGQNQSQPAIHQTAGNTFKSTSHTNFFPDTQSHLSHHITKTTSQKNQDVQHQQYTMGTSDDQLSSHTTDILPPLTKNSVQAAEQQTTTKQNLLDIRDNEFVEKLTLQITEKDNLIRKLQTQVDDFSRQRLARLQNASETKGGSAGPANAKTELARIKKQLKDKEKEIIRLKAADSQNRDEAANNAQDNEQLEKKLKQLQGQINTQNKKAIEAKNELKKKEEQNEKLSRELSQVTDSQKKLKESQKQEVNQNENQLQSKLDELTLKNKQSAEEKDALAGKLAQSLKAMQEMEIDMKKKEIESENVYESKPAENEIVADKAAPKAEKAKESDKREATPQLNSKAEGELGLISTVLGCRENRDRIEFAEDLKDFVGLHDLTQEEREAISKKRFTLASDYQLTLSQSLINYLKNCRIADLALSMPKYEFISPSLALIIMQEIRKMLIDPELLEILDEKESEKRLPFDALRDLCSRFDRIFTDEHCAFITASYLTEIDEGFIYINFKEFLADLKDAKARADLELTGSKHRATSSIGSEGSDSEIRRMMMRAGMQQKAASKTKVDEEHMLDIAEAIFIKMSDLMLKKGRTVRGIFTKYSVPEIFPDRTILELLSPAAFLEGIKDTGIGELQEFEVACLMRVLAKPELDNAVILNEFVMIMENFGVMDQMDADESDDYISDTDMSIAQSQTDLKANEETEDRAAAEADIKIKDEDKQQKPKDEEESKEEGKEEMQEEQAKKLRKPRTHNLANIDAKGIKILRKIARFLLKQFLHPREFFGKAIAKEKIKTKKREFHLDVLKFKDFYLRVKIANIRKRLVENESLNKELCLDQKSHKEYINVKLMVKALEEIAEEEQKALIEEEKVAENLAKENSETRKDTTIGASDVETPRSDSEKEQEDSGSKKKGEKSDESKKGKLDQPKDSYGAGTESMKFGNAAIRSKNNGTHSPLLGERQFANLITIEEDKNETQTSNYFENASEREDSRMMSSNQLRGSNLNGMEFDDGDKTSSLQKLSPKNLNKMLNQSDKQMSASQTGVRDDIEQINANVDLPNGSNKDNEAGRLTGRATSWKEQQLSKSLADTTINRFKEREDDEENIMPTTPLTVQDKLTDGLPTPKAAPPVDVQNQTNEAKQE